VVALANNFPRLCPGVPCCWCGARRDVVERLRSTFVPGARGHVRSATLTGGRRNLRWRDHDLFVVFDWDSDHRQPEPILPARDAGPRSRRSTPGEAKLVQILLGDPAGKSRLNQVGDAVQQVTTIGGIERAMSRVGEE
jgi:hypothetical protein